MKHYEVTYYLGAPYMSDLLSERIDAPDRGTAYGILMERLTDRGQCNSDLNTWPWVVSIKYLCSDRCVKHYKTLDNLFLRNGDTDLYYPRYGVRMPGNSWYRSGYFSSADRQRPATLKKYGNRWEIVLGSGR